MLRANADGAAATQLLAPSQLAQGAPLKGGVYLRFRVSGSVVVRVSQVRRSNTKGYSSTDLAMGFANVRAGTQKRLGNTVRVSQACARRGDAMLNAVFFDRVPSVARDNEA